MFNYKLLHDMINARILLMLAALLCLPSAAFSQAQRSRDFKNKYRLKEAVVLSLSTTYALRFPATEARWAS